jgi:Zinc dependent phospholipase C
MFTFTGGGLMPGVTLHLLLAERTLQALEERPDSAPFPPSLPMMRNAFRQGALGPDLGYFPGGHEMLSDLAHTASTGDLARTLVRTARTPIERAFAWGWLTHVVSDGRVHPLVGRGVGRLRTGDPSLFIGGHEDPAGHVRVETGIDAWISFAHPEIARLPIRTVFNRTSITFLSRSYDLTYGLRLDPRLFLASHTAQTRLARPALALCHTLGRELAGATPAIPIRLLRKLLSWRSDARVSSGGEPASLAYLSPVRPDAELARLVMREVDSFPERFLALLDTDLRGLENRDLDTGALEPPRSGPPAAPSWSTARPKVPWRATAWAG